MLNGWYDKYTISIKIRRYRVKIYEFMDKFMDTLSETYKGTVCGYRSIIQHVYASTVWPSLEVQNMKNMICMC